MSPLPTTSPDASTAFWPPTYTVLNVARGNYGLAVGRVFMQSLRIEVFYAPSHRGPIIESGAPLFTETSEIVNSRKSLEIAYLGDALGFALRVRYLRYAGEEEGRFRGSAREPEVLYRSG